MVEVFGEQYDIAVSHSKRYFAGLSDVHKPKPNAYGRIWVFDTKSQTRVFNRYLTKDETSKFYALYWNRKDQLVEGMPENGVDSKQVVLWDPRKRN